MYFRKKTQQLSSFASHTKHVHLEQVALSNGQSISENLQGRRFTTTSGNLFPCVTTITVIFFSFYQPRVSQFLGFFTPCSSPPTTLPVLHWICSRMFVSFLYWGGPNWTEHSAYSFTSDEQRWIHPFQNRPLCDWPFSLQGHAADLYSTCSQKSSDLFL